MHQKIDRLKDKLDRLDERCSLKGVSYSSQPSSTVTQTLDDILAQKEYLREKLVNYKRCNQDKQRNTRQVTGCR